MKELKVGVIGCGAISSDHALSINKHPQAKTVAVCDIHEGRAKALQAKCGATKIYRAIKDILADPELDAVGIALPNYLHASTAIAALQAGKHVLLDKPFCLNYAEAAKVAAAAKKARKVFMLGMTMRYRQSSQVIRELVKRGDLGDIYHGKACWLRRTGTPRMRTWFCRKDMAGGGCTLDIGVHMLDLCLFLMDNFEPVAVSGKTYTKFGNRGLGEGGWGYSDRGEDVFDVDDFATAFIKMKNGATVSLDVSWVAHQAEANRNDVQLFGDAGGAMAWEAQLFRFGKKKGEYEVIKPSGVKIPMPHCNRHVNWIDAILGLDKPLTTIKQSLVIQKILDAVYLSSKTGKEVRIK
ncbi:MAG: Gfo/Idh/MocA family oxidoreductase [Candidatus Sumerlaeota bacterium]|nr:Gfo/Idh/MocA family oxidoreductase [Candidatus Sumerlaeota bacterium]